MVVNTGVMQLRSLLDNFRMRQERLRENQRKRKKQRKTHTRTVVPKCFKGDDASQWKRPNFDPSPH